jgi:hypothetical protein
MRWIEGLKYGLVGLGALLALWAAARLRIQGQAPDRSGIRLSYRLVTWCLALLVLAGLVSAYQSGLLPGGNRPQTMERIVARMDQTIGGKLNVDNDVFASLDTHSKQIVENMLRKLCEDVVDLARIAPADAPSCRARLERAPADGAT